MGEPPADRRVAEAVDGFARPELDPLWREARRRFEAASGTVARITLRGLSGPQRAALADLLGLAYTPESELTVQVPRLDSILLASPAGLDTRGVLTMLGGPLVDRASERRHRADAREELWRWLAGHPAVTAEPTLLPWAAWARTAGLVAGDVERTRELLDRALRVLAALPAGGDPLPGLAAAVTGDPHALDDGTRLGTYVLRALAALHGEDVPADAEQRRRLWWRAGVARDDLSTVVIVAGLRPPGDGPLAVTLRAWSAAGQAASITLAQVKAERTGYAGADVFVVENPSVVATALNRFGDRCPPLVCVSGWPNTAAIALLRDLAAGGTTLHYHGDLDGEGVRIAAHVIAKTGARPWRMSTGDYLAAVRPDGPPAGRVTEAPWDPGLAAAMIERRASVPEESVLAVLLADLATACAGVPVPVRDPDGAPITGGQDVLDLLGGTPDRRASDTGPA